MLNFARFLIALSAACGLVGCSCLKLDPGEEPARIEWEKAGLNGYVSLDGLRMAGDTPMRLTLNAAPKANEDSIGLGIDRVVYLGVGITGARMQTLFFAAAVGTTGYHPKPWFTGVSVTSNSLVIDQMRADLIDLKATGKYSATVTSKDCLTKAGDWIKSIPSPVCLTCRFCAGFCHWLFCCPSQMDKPKK